MKKVLLAAGLASFLFASDASDKAIDFIKNLVPKGYEVELVKTEKIPNSNYEFVEFNIIENGVVKGSDVFFTDGNYGSPTLFDLKNKTDLKADFMAKKEAEKQNQIIAKLPDFIAKHKDMTVRLGNSGKDVVTVVFSDPDCPWCKKQIGGVEEKIKEGDILLVLTPLPMHPNALGKSVNILKETKNAKTDAEKIKILQKYFADNVDYKEPSDAEKDALAKKVEEVFELGVSYTPAVFKDIKLK